MADLLGSVAGSCFGASAITLPPIVVVTILPSESLTSCPGSCLSIRFLIAPNLLEPLACSLPVLGIMPIG